MTTELASLPSDVLYNVWIFSGTTNTGASGNVITGISSNDIANIKETMVISGPGIPVGALVEQVGMSSIVLSDNATAAGTGTFTVGFTSYAAESIFNALPQFVQDHDATSFVFGHPDKTFPLYRFIFESVSILDNQVFPLVNYSVGANGQFDPEYIDAPGWSQLLDINRCPDWALPWLGQLLGIPYGSYNGLTQAQKIDKISSRPTFDRGTVAILQNALAQEINYKVSNLVSTVITPEQILIMEQTKPNTVYFLGNTHASTTIDSIASSNTAKLSSGMTLYGPDIALGTTISSVSSTSITVNKAATGSTNGEYIRAVSRSVYTQDQYSMVILIPAIYYNNYTYETLAKQLSGVTTISYDTLDTDINNLGAGYAGLYLDGVAKSETAFAPFIYKYRPAGVQVFIGAY